MKTRNVTAPNYTFHTRIYEQQTADGSPMVLIHGFGISGKYLEKIAEALAPHYPLYIPDLPGFGLSSKPPHVLNIPETGASLLPWLDELGLQKVHLVGASNGCQVAAEFAAKYPERILTCSLLGPSVNPHERTPYLLLKRWKENGKYEPNNQLKYMAIGYAQCGIPRLYKTFFFTLWHKIEEVLPDIQAPTLVMRGSLDKLVPADWAQEATDLLPKGTLVTVKDKSHTLVLNAPTESADIIHHFIQTKSS